jgi:amidase
VLLLYFQVVFIFFVLLVLFSSPVYLLMAAWETIAAEYQKEAAAKIPREWLLPAKITESICPSSTQNVLDIPRTCGLLSTEEIDITENYNAVTLSEHLASGKFSSLAVTTAFCKRAAIAQQLVSTQRWGNKEA